MERRCHIDGCADAGLPFPMRACVISECTERTKLRLVNGKSSNAHPAKTRNWKRLADDNSPAMSPLGAFPAHEMSELNLPNQSLTISASSNQEDLNKRPKELGAGRGVRARRGTQWDTHTSGNRTQVPHLMTTSAKQVFRRNIYRIGASRLVNGRRRNLIIHTACSAFSSRPHRSSTNSDSESSLPSRARK